MTRRSTICALAMLLASTPGARGQEQGTAPTEMTCLELRLLANPAGADPARWGAVHHPPDTVALDTARILVAGSPRGYLLRPTIGEREPRDGRFAPSWRASGDSLEMFWTNGLTGVHLRGRLQDGVYRGDATLVTDVVTPLPRPRALVEGKRVECPARFQRGSDSLPSIQ